MLPCKEIVQILGSQEDSTRTLPWQKRAELRLHLMMCKHCSRYATHLRMMKDGFRKLFAKMTHVDQGQVSQLENEVLERLKKQGK